MNGIIALQSSSHLKGVRIIDSCGHNVISDNAVLLLSYLAQHQQKGYFFITWDLTTFLAPIFRLLPPDVVNKLNSGERAIWPPFRLFYSVFKGKFFGINFKERIHNHDNFYNETTYDINIYELKTFFPGEPQPQSVDDVAKKGYQLLKTLADMGMQPTKLTSPAAIYEETMLRRMPIPNINTLPDGAIPMLEWCWNYIREWRAVYQIGIWTSGSVWEYDRTAAYPSEIARLPNITKADFIHTKGDYIPPGIGWGIMKGTVTIDADISPVIYDDGTARTGTYPCLLPKEEWDCIRRHNIGNFIPEEGLFFRVPYLQYIFDYPMKRLYGFRNSRDLLKDYIAKSASVSLWGKFQEMHKDKYGDFWNSIYACMTASRNRIAVCDFIYDNKLSNDLITVRVDGLAASKHLDIPTVKSFGEWRLNPPSPAMVLSAAHQWIGGNRPNGKDVNEMIKDVTGHPSSMHWGGIHLATLEHDRYYEHLPKNGRGLLQCVYRSKPFTVPSEYKKDTP